MQVSAAEKGKELSDKLFSVARLSGGKPKARNLISSVPNAFAYNIEIEFQQDSKNEDQTSSKTDNTPVVVLFHQEEIVENTALLQKLITNLNENEKDRDIKIVLVFGNNAKPEKQNMVNGTKSYLTLTENPNAFYINARLNQTETAIKCGSGSNITSSNLVKAVLDGFAKKGARCKGSFFLSQAYKTKLISDSDLDVIFSEGQNGITVNFKESDHEKGADILWASVSSDFLNSSTDSHSLIFKAFGRVFSISESIILILFFITVITTLIILFAFSFVSKSYGFLSWKKISKIWYYPIISLLLIILSVLFMRSLFKLFNRITGVQIDPLTFIFTATTFAFIFISILIITVINFPQDFKKRTVDYLLIYTTAINLFIFSLTDISLLPIYYSVFIICIVGSFIKQTWIHILKFLAVHIPFIPYVNTVLSLSDKALLSGLIYDSKLFTVIYALNLTPAILIWFRVLTGMNFNMYDKKLPVFKKIRFSYIFTISALLLNSIILLVLMNTSFRNINQATISEPFFEKMKDPPVKLSYKQKKVFGETIRTIYVTMEKDCSQAELKVNGKTITPVIFSDNENILENSRTTEFVIPSQPPRKMEFSYGTDSSNDTAVIFTAWFETDEDGIYETAQKSLVIRGRK